MTMRRVILESPYGSDDEMVIAANVDYARAAVRDCLTRNESPIASHLLFTQPGILRDKVPAERELGIAAGLAWLVMADAMVLYIDRGMSPGMQAAMKEAQRVGVPTELRSLSTITVGGVTGSGEGHS